MATGDPPLTFADLDAIPLTRLKGIGEKRAAALEKAGMVSVLDLLTHYPRRYIDRTREADIASLEPGEEGMVLCRVLRAESRRTRNRRTLVTVKVTDGSGNRRARALPRTTTSRPRMRLASRSNSAL